MDVNSLSVEELIIYAKEHPELTIEYASGTELIVYIYCSGGECSSPIYFNNGDMYG